MGGFLKKFLGGVGSVATLAAPFIPGIGGKIAGLIGGVGAMANANGQAQAQASGQNQIAQTMAGQYNQYSPDFLKAQLMQSGIDPATGAFDPNYNPAQSLHDSLYSDPAIASRATALFDPRQLQPEMGAYKGANAGAYESAVQDAGADATNRGFVGGDTNLSSNVANIRRGEAQNMAGFSSNLLTNLFNQKRGYIEGQQNQGNNLLTQGYEDRGRNLTNTGGFLNNSAQGAIGTMGGLQGFYANNAARAAQGVGDAVGSIAKSFPGFNPADLFGQIFKRKQSQSLGTTTAQGGSPAPNYQSGATSFANGDI